MKFWLDTGVDGFRLDVINFIAKDKKFRNNPYFFWNPLFQQHIFTRNRRKSVKIVKELRKLTNQYDDRVMVGEIYTLPPGNSKIAGSYLAGGNGIHLAFDFSLIFRSWNAKKYYKCIAEGYRHVPDNCWPSVVLSNHDLFRSIDRFPWRLHKDKKAKVAAALLLTLKGTPFIYYGEEIGMRNSKVRYRDIQDPLGKRFWPLFSGRDKARTPMQWDSGKHGGFSTGTPWLPVNADSSARNVEKQHQQYGSLLNFYRSLIHLRKAYLSLQQGQWIPLITGRKGLFAYMRIHEDQKILVVLNFRGQRTKINLAEHISGSVLLSTHREPNLLIYFQNHWISAFEVTICLA
jgi:alpha-glucosidase